MDGIVKEDGERTRLSAEALESVKRSNLRLSEYVNVHLHILLAEDDASNRKVALLMLRRLGYDADVAANGLEVLEAFISKRYDLVLMDIMMPGMNGFEAARAIRALKGISQPKIIAFTAYILPDLRARCIEAGMDDCLIKPVCLKGLSAMIRCVDPAIAVKS